MTEAKRNEAGGRGKKGGGGIGNGGTTNRGDSGRHENKEMGEAKEKVMTGGGKNTFSKNTGGRGGGNRGVLMANSRGKVGTF